MFLCVCLVATYVHLDSDDGFRRYVEGVVLERSPARLAIAIRKICMRIPA